MKLTLIIATFNRATSLLRTLKSAVEQSAAADLWECIVVNNNSTDNTEEIFDMFEDIKQDSDILDYIESEERVINELKYP